MGAGRPDKYKKFVEPYLSKIEEMALTMSEEDIAKTLGISYSTFRRYKSDHEQLKAALQKGRKDLVFELKSALIQKARGFRYTEKKEIYSTLSVNDDLYERLLEDGYSPEELKGIRWLRTEVTEKYSAPDVAAANLLLKNYDRDNWANDPQMLRLREKEIELRERQIENSEW